VRTVSTTVSNISLLLSPPPPPRGIALVVAENGDDEDVADGNISVVSSAKRVV
jgi:hypothetical protein